MFYSVFVLGKKGPLARVWLAAHWDKKITKAQILETNIVESVDSILQPRVKLSLRTSSHLLLGIVRIYARKTLYLLQDCQDAAFKIKSAFRPGAVDLPDGKTEAAISAITLPEMLDFVNDFDLLVEPPVQIEPLQTNTNVRAITLIEELATETTDVFGDGGIDKRWTDYSSVQGMNTSKADESSIQLENQKHPLDILDRVPVDDGFGGPVGLTDVDDMFALPVPPEAQQQMEAEAAAARDDVGGEEPRPSSRQSDQSDSMSYGNPASAAPSVDSSPEPPPVNEDHEMSELPPRNDQDHSMGPPMNREIDAFDPDESIARREEPMPKPDPHQTMVLEPLGEQLERKRKRRKKLGITIDEVKVLSGEEMKAQLSDTSDIVTTLDLAPPTKKLMHWKRTGGSEKLFALSEKPIPSKVLIMYYTRHLVTTRVQEEEELQDETMNGELEDLQEPTKERPHIPQEDYNEHLLPPISPLKEIQPPKTPRTPRRETDTHKSPVKKKRKLADDREKPDRKSKASVHSERLSNHVTDSREINDSSLSFGRDASYDRFTPESTLHEKLSDFPNLPILEEEEQYQDQYEQPMSVGPPEEMMPDETAEQYEERMRNKRTNVLLRLMSKQLEEGAVSFTRLVCHNRRKQVAQKFFSLLVLKKQQAIELHQDMDVPYGEISITKGYRYDEAIASSS